MKNSIKRIIFVIIILIIIISIHTETLAWDTIIGAGKSFVGAGTESTISGGNLQNLSGYIYNVLLAAGVIISVIIAAILGVQFMFGGAEGQAKVKEMLLPYIVGCIIVFGGFAFWKIAVEIGQKLETAQIYIIKLDTNIKIAEHKVTLKREGNI